MTDNSLRARYEREYPRLEQHAAALLASLRDAFREDERIVLIEARAKKIVSFLRKAEGLENGGEPKTRSGAASSCAVRATLRK